MTYVVAQFAWQLTGPANSVHQVIVTLVVIFFWAAVCALCLTFDVDQDTWFESRNLATFCKVCAGYSSGIVIVVAFPVSTATAQMSTAIYLALCAVTFALFRPEHIILRRKAINTRGGA